MAAPLVAIAGLAGVVLTAVLGNRQALRRLEFDAAQAERAVDRERRTAIREGVERLAEVMLESRDMADYQEPPGYDGAPFDLNEEWEPWWGRREKIVRRDVARIREDDVRVSLEVVSDALAYAPGIAWTKSHFRHTDDVIRVASITGFDVATSWLREEGVSAGTADRVEELRAAVEAMVASSPAHTELDAGDPPRH